MFRWRLPDFTRMLVGQHIVNGLSVGAGVMAIAVTATALFGFAAGQPATLGAISASISDLPAPWREKARSLSVGFALALVSTSAIQLALPWPPAALAVIGAVAFACGMITGWGRWAVALGMQALIPVVFVLGFPRESFAAAVKIQILFAAGGFAYIAFAVVATVVTDASARRLLASETIRELSIYLRAVAAAFDPETDFEQAYGSAIRQQAALSEQLQSARALLLDHARPGSESLRLAATIGVLLDAFDALIAAQCDIAKIRRAPPSTTLLRQIGEALRVGALDLLHLSLRDPGDQPADAAAGPSTGDRRPAARGGAAGRGRSAGPGRARRAQRRDRPSRARAQSYPPAREGPVGRQDGGGGDRARGPQGVSPQARLFLDGARTALHHRLSGAALFGPPGARDDGRRDRRPVSRRTRGTETGCCSPSR